MNFCTRSLFQLLPCLSPLALSFRNKNGCKSRSAEWQEGHDSRHLPPVLPKRIWGRLCWSQLLTASRAWLRVLADRKIPRVGFMQLNKLRKEADKAQKWWLKRSAPCLPQRCCGARCWEEGLLRSSSWTHFWSAARRISLRESRRISCPVVALLLAGYARWSFCNGLTLLVWGFSHFLCRPRNCSLKNDLCISLCTIVI